MNLIKDKKFIKTLAVLAVPIALQNLVASSLNMVDAIMVGYLGETAIAAVGIANQIFFLLNLLLFGTYSGACIFASQYWGKGDTQGVRMVLGASLKVGCSLAFVFTLVSLLLPKQVIGIFTTDSEVIKLGVQFITLNAWSYILFAITFCYALLSRSTGNVRLPMLASIVALTLNTLLNFLLIRGSLGFPRMGVRGAGLATLASRFVEAAILLLAVYIAKYPVAAGRHELFSFDPKFIRRFFSTTLPVILHEGLWSLGATAYIFVYSHMGTNVIASMNIASNIERLSMVLFFGISNACAIMIGHRIGEDKPEQAYHDAGKLLVLGPVIGIAAGALLMISFSSILSLFNVSSDVTHATGQILKIIAVLMPFRIFNLIMIVGVSRAGGDTKYGLAMEILPMWLIAIPLAAISGLYFKFPLLVVYLMACTEEFIKMGFGLRRFFTRKWIHNVTHR